MKTKNQHAIPTAKAAVLALAEIKAAVEAFDRGEANAFDALDGIIVAVEAYQAEPTAKPRRKRARPEAA